MDQSTVYELSFVMLRITHRSQTVDLNKNLKNAFEIRFWSQKWRFFATSDCQAGGFCQLDTNTDENEKGEEKVFKE
jgi:hypothetical protein